MWVIVWIQFLNQFLSISELRDIWNYSYEISFTFMILLGGWKIYLDFYSLYEIWLTNQHLHITDLFCSTFCVYIMFFEWLLRE